MTLNELLDKTPDQFKPVVQRYGPALVVMTAEQFCEWLELLLLGKTYDAMAAIYERLPNADLFAAWQANAADWDAANLAQAARLQLQRDAAMAVLKVLLAVSLAAVGL